MNRRIRVSLIFLTVVSACLVGGACFTFYLGIAFDRGPFSSESRVQFLIRSQGGTRILLEADVPPGVPIPSQDMEAAKAIIHARLNELGTDAIVRTSDERHLMVELPGNVTLGQVVTEFGTGLLEFIDAGGSPLQEGQIVQTTGLSTVIVPGQPSPTLAPVSPPLYRTVMTGRDLRSVSVVFQQTTNQPCIQFTLTDDGAKILADFTSQNVGKYLAITMDKKVIASPVIKDAITQGNGIIEGRFTLDEVRQLVLKLKHGALPFPLKVVEVAPIPK